MPDDVKKKLKADRNNPYSGVRQCCVVHNVTQSQEGHEPLKCFLVISLKLYQAEESANWLNQFNVLPQLWEVGPRMQTETKCSRKYIWTFIIKKKKKLTQQQNVQKTLWGLELMREVASAVRDETGSGCRWARQEGETSSPKRHTRVQTENIRMVTKQKIKRFWQVPRVLSHWAATAGHQLAQKYK